MLQDPIRFIDPTGELAHVAAAAIAGGLVGALSSFVDPSGGFQWGGWRNLAISTATGVLGGVAVATLNPALGIGLDLVANGINVANATSSNSSCE